VTAFWEYMGQDAEQVSVKRNDTDRTGKTAKSDADPVRGVFSWGIGTRSSGRFNSGTQARSESAKISPQLYVSADSDVQARDSIIRSNGEKYRVVGHAIWDADFVYDWGVKVFQLESDNG